MTFLEDELHERKAEHWYLANIAFQIYLLRHVVKHLLDPSPPKPEITDFQKFLLSFREDDEVEQEDDEAEEETEDQRVERITRSRKFWLTGVGLSPDGKLKTQKPPTPEQRKKMKERLKLPPKKKE